LETTEGFFRKPVRISVYITSYNQKAYLIEAIESVLNQTLRPFEIIITDDCSADGSQKLIEGYAQAHPGLIRPFYHDQNLGIPKNRGFALEQVQGDLVTYLDGDDRFLPRKLELELETFIDHPEAQIVYSNVYYIDADGQRTGLWADGNTPPPSGYVFREVFSRHFPHGSLFRNELVPYSCLSEVGLYDDRFPTHEDWDMKIRLTKHFKVAYCPEPLSEYRLHSGGLSSLPASMRLNSMRGVYEKNCPLLDDLPEADRVMIEKRLSAKFAQLARRATGEELETGSRKLALKYWLESLRYSPRDFDLGLAAQVMLPRWVYRRLGDVYRGFRNM
jgi:glycosyltransferase involved in cell wall biosynthesis